MLGLISVSGDLLGGSGDSRGWLGMMVSVTFFK